MQGRFHNTSPGDIENTFIKDGDSETKKGLRIEEATEGRLGSASSGSLETLQERSEPCWAAWTQ